MKSAFNTETLRSITHSLGRFLAIAAIVALGTGFYAGLRMTAPDMKLAADEYFDGTSLMDIRVLSTLGLTDDDIAALRHVEGVEAVMPARETDVMASIDGEQYATRVHSLPDAARTSDTSDGVHARSDDPDYLNRPLLVRGSWPQKTGECVLSANLVENDAIAVGDTLTITEGVQDVDQTLVTRTYTVTGFVNAPYYATSSSMGETTLGSGSIQQYMYVPESDFSADLPYTEAYLTVRGAANERASSDAYQRLVDEVADRIKALAPEREQARVDQLKSDAQKELDEKRADYEGERADAQSQLDDAKRQLDDAAATIAASEQELADGQAAYDSGASELASRRASAQAQLDDAERQIAEGQAQLDAQRPQLDDAAGQLQAARAQWQQGADALAAAWGDWQRQSDELDAGITRAQAGVADAAAGVDRIQKGIDALEEQIKQLDPDKDAQKIAELRAEQDALKAQQQDLRAQMALVQATLDDLVNVQKPKLEAARAELQGKQDALDSSKVELEQQQAAYEGGKAQFDASARKLDQARADLASSRSQADAQIAAAQQQLDDAAARLQDGRAQLEQGRADYDSGLAEYEQKKSDADAQLADAERRLDDAQKQIDDLERPEWLVMDRTANYGAASFEADADRVDSIAAVFPFIFFLVAALVALTTMTRMVEEERALIGTFKALGYRRTRIASKYLAYAAAASGIGSILGILALSQVLPAVIMKAYGIIYFVPELPLPLPVDPGFAGLAAGLGVGVTLFATWAAVAATLRERPAQLMLPRAPKAGKRIVLERIGPLWRHLSFSWKVTFRNLFRYKKRFVMTVIGIAGCTALLLTGLGLSNAINDIIDKQFGEITKYNAVVTLADDLSSEEQRRIDDLLDDGSLVTAHTLAMRQNMLAGGPDEQGKRMELVVPEDPASFDRFVALNTRVGHHPVKLDDDGFVLTEKLAAELGVRAGDAVTLTEQDAIGNATGTSYEATVTGIVENYVYHYAYMGPALYEQLMGKAPDYRTVLAVTTSDPDLRVQFSNDLLAAGGVKTVAYNDETIDAYRDMMSSVNMIVVVLVTAAAALAFIVLYNLTNINITERMREIATLKVLGFTPREMNAYIFREIFLLAAIGCAVGLVLGVWMEGFVVVTAEVDQIMFGRAIHPTSFLLAFLLTMLFTVLVMLAMRGKLRRIDMVESLKSNE
ncbi:FtsX-like permease family protein [Eggerthella lenta]|uniref:FtsX-like permease family protein n=1 Tax=Eggerthella lenta TaxID=84112 RepID=UPI001C2BCCF3|nr:ABC transporter permease [Eggerthella lenta]MBV4057159.1 ABC transporter permease [Eggerthella lenta]MBV4104643.1 ABC transporter permease [Eggerthella lenta]MBV4128051.1 ABC transporter permease [Eggerthella lenta]MBV4142198.1 ABC transporter permease [Eggerthella lenta]